MGANRRASFQKLGYLCGKYVMKVFLSSNPRLSKVLPVSARNTMKEASDQEPIRELYSRLNETGKF